MSETLQAASTGASARGGSPLAAADLAALRQRLARRGISLALSGIDGSGKTSLAAAAVSLFSSFDVPSRAYHRYRWLDNVFVTPLIVAWNRYVGRKLLVFDRCYLDNIAKFFPGGRRAPALVRHAARYWRALTPGLDRVVYLEAPYDEILKRGRRMPEGEYRRLQQNYHTLVGAGWLVPVASDEGALCTILSALVATARTGGLEGAR